MKGTNAQRRQVTATMKKLFDEWRANSRKYGRGDPFNEIETIRLYEPGDTEKADVIVSARTIENMLDTDGALEEIKGLAKKAVAFFIETDSLRKLDEWREIIARRFFILEATPLEAGHIWIIGSCTSPFGQDANVVVGGKPEDRWDNIVANSKLTTFRVQKSAPHNRKAILACYGPSLASNLVPLIDESKNQLADVVSVSGSHDYLLSHGIRPDFHVECDARAHKADNIAKGIEEVKYLIGSPVHPDFMAKLTGYDLTLWHPSGEFNFKIVDELEPGALLVGGGSNVGLRSMVLFYQMGYRSFSVYGMDCSFSDDGEQKWAGAHASKKIQTEQKIIQVRCDGRIFTSSPIYLLYANQFFDSVKMLPDAEFRVYGDNLLGAMSRTYMKQAEAA